jgi:hypothetical protein
MPWEAMEGFPEEVILRLTPRDKQKIKRRGAGNDGTSLSPQHLRG